MQPTIQTVPDAAAAELLKPADAHPDLTGITTEPPGADSEAAFQKALRDGTIPTFDDLPSEASTTPPPPLDIAAEREAWESLLAMINLHKDAGTIVEAVSADEFVKGLQ